MKIRIISSCTGDKIHSPENQLTQDDFYKLHTPDFAALEAKLDDYRTPAETIYSGMQHVRLMDGVKAYRESHPADIELWILSAGYGLIPADRQVVPYECTFQGMKPAEIKKWAEHLNVPTEARQLFSQPADLTIVLLGDSYLQALRLDDKVEFASPVLFFTSAGSQKQVKGQGQWRTVPLMNKEAKRFSIGLVGLKGELTRRLLSWLGAHKEDGLARLFDAGTDILTLLDGEEKEKRPVKKAAQANPNVDKVIDIPEAWWQKSHRAKLRYFIPEWDDLVDPDYDFENDGHSGGTGDWSNETYAHQMYPEPNYDGILISKVVAEKSKKKKERINAMGVHRFLRVPRQFPIMGDCGAFGYIGEEVPPYTTDEILDYYTRLDFDYGVSIDHLIVTATEQQKQFRYDLTIHNAEDFLKEHRKRGLSWEPIGAVQGWDAPSYTEGARRYVAMGYKYIALGGLVRTGTAEILRVLQSVHEVVPETVKIHLFGLARIGAISQFAAMGVRSIDSASYLRQAWMRGAQGYLLEEGQFATIRIPEAGKSFRSKDMIKKRGLEEQQVIKMEQHAIGSLRAFAKHQCSLEDCLDAVLEYDQHISENRVDMSALYRRTLEERPWEKCTCDICRKSGVEVVIFRGNNRNRRRGFHNTYVFYDLIQRILNGEEVGGWATQKSHVPQIEMFEAEDFG